MPFGIQPIHIFLIIIVALLLFGPKRLPEMGRNIGKAISERLRQYLERTQRSAESAARSMGIGYRNAWELRR